MFSPETFLGTAVDFVGVDTDEKRKAFFVIVIILLSAEEVNDGSSAQEGREETEVVIDLTAFSGAWAWRGG